MAARMADALVAAGTNAGGDLLERPDALFAVNQMSWRYDDLAGFVSGLAGLNPACQLYGPVGGESPWGC